MFITFEGIDFCGKSTQVELLKNYLVENKKTVEIIREPGGTEISEKIREVLLDKKHYHMFMETEIFLFSSSRAQLVREKIRPYLEKGVYVISDRFHDSTTAYQGFGRGIDINTVRHINNLAIGKTIPDVTFIIDIPVKVAEERKKLKTNMDLDRIEISDSVFYEKVRQGYLTIAESEKRFRIIDGNADIKTIHQKVVNEITMLDIRSIHEAK
ncbi:MAG TPA: dTMP kinase [Ignavibacteriaceae bacterium]|nr:dTMP kinase [Ignavibacteriaceae bacterium]